MKVLFDVNVILDVILLREPHHEHAVRLMAEVEHKRIEGFLCAASVTTIYYLIRKMTDKRTAVSHVSQLMKLFAILPVDANILNPAFSSDLNDYEDAVIHETAVQSDLDAIVTRNSRDFRKARIMILTPDELVELLRSAQSSKGRE